MAHSTGDGYDIDIAEGEPRSGSGGLSDPISSLTESLRGTFDSPKQVTPDADLTTCVFVPHPRRWRRDKVRGVTD